MQPDIPTDSHLKAPNADTASTGTFAAATALEALEPVGGGRFAASSHPDWTIGGKANGGYLLALLARAAVATGDHPHVLAASAHYLRSPDPGPVVVEAEVLRAGRSAGQLRVRLLQGGRPCVEALITTATLDPAAEPYWSGDLPAAPVSGSHGRPTRLPGTNPSGVRVAILDQVELRMDHDDLGWASGAPSGAGELRGTLALPDGEDFDPVSLLFAVDALPPGTFDVELTGWVPTLELTAYVRALPAPGPVRVLQRAHLIEGQRVDEQCWVWDSRGRLVAQATQLAGIRLG